MEEVKNTNIENSKKKSNQGLIIAAVVLLVVILGGIGYFYYKKESKSLFVESYHYLTKGFKEMKLSDLNIKDTFKGDSKVTSNVKMNISEDFPLGIKEIAYSIVAQEGKNNNLGKYRITSSIDGEEFINANLYRKEERLYFNIEDMLNEYYYFTNQGFSSTLKTTAKDYDFQTLINIVAESLRTEIKESDFKTKDNVKTEIDGKEETLSVKYLEITDELGTRIATKILEDIKNNEKALTTLENLMDMTADEIKEEIEELLKEEELSTNEVILTYYIYHKNGEIRKLELTDNENDSIIYTGNDNKYTFEIWSEEQEPIILVIEKEAKQDAYSFQLEIEDITIEGIFQQKNNTCKIEIKIKEGRDTLAKITINQEKINDVESKMEASIEIDNVEYITLTMDSKVEEAETIKEEDFEGAKPIEEMTESQQEKLLVEIMNHKALRNIMKVFSALSI